MKKAILSTIISFVAILLITQDRLAAATLGFLMTGAVPGTSANIPFWAMLAFYCLAITAIITIYVEKTFILPRHTAPKTSKHGLPKRRYNAILG